MVIFRKVGKVVGSAAGTVVGGGVKLIGKAVESKWVEEVDKGIHSASTIAFDNAGQFLDGAAKSTYGVMKQDEIAKMEGLSDLKDSTNRTVKGIGNTICYTAENAKSTFAGLKNGNQEQAVEGVKNIGKVVAVAALAVGVLDVIDEPDLADAKEIDTRNADLAGESHPETGVPFVEKTVELPTGEISGTFPVFESVYELTIPEDLYLQTDYVQFSFANAELYSEIETNPSLMEEMELTTTDVQALSIGETPEGFTWHHNEEAGVLQLVDEETHQSTGHTGGRELWGGGETYK